MKRMFKLLSVVLLATAAAMAAGTGSISGTVAKIPAPKALPGAFPPPPMPAVVFAVPAKAAPHEAKTADMNQQWSTFTPGVLGVPVGTTVRFLNNDSVTHNVTLEPVHGAKKSLGDHPPSQETQATFTHPGAVHVDCTLHPAMTAWIYVAPTPYVTTTDAQGHYKLTGLPAGQYRVEVWHPEASAPAHTVTVSSDTKVDFTLRSH